MLIRQLSAAVMNDLIGTYAIFILRGLILSTLVLKISAQGLKTTLLEINQRPLKILDWQTPYQVMLTNLSKNSD